MGTNEGYRIVISGNPDEYHKIRRLVHFAALQQGIEEQEADIIERAVAEACSNALFHEPAEKENPSFVLEMQLNDASITSIVKNRGKAFNFDDVEPFDIQQDFMAYKEGGLGIPIMKRLMDIVQYERHDDNLNVVTLVKNINPQREKGAEDDNEN